MDWTKLRDALGREDARPPDLEAAFAKLEGELAREAGIRAWLRSRPTSVRRAVVLGAVVLGALAALGASGLRGDLRATALERLALDVGLLASLVVVNVRAALRPLHASPRPAWMRLTLALASPLVAALAMLCAAGACGREPSPGPGGPALPCYAIGIGVGVPVALAAWLVARQASAARALLAAAAAGIAGLLVLDLHCPSHAREHLLLGHAAVAATFMAGAGLGALRRTS